MNDQPNYESLLQKVLDASFDMRDKQNRYFKAQQGSYEKKGLSGPVRDAEHFFDGLIISIHQIITEHKQAHKNGSTTLD